MSEAALLTVDEAAKEIFTDGKTPTNRKRMYKLIHSGQIESLQCAERGHHLIPRRAIAKLRGDDE
tara:strand:- start:514 stop:708 length:195 start_codon:yes stop_codon:yes gene_type:complete